MLQRRELLAHPLEPLPAAFRMAAAANPITWQVDVLRYATVGIGVPSQLVVQGALFLLFGAACFAAALAALRRQE